MRVAVCEDQKADCEQLVSRLQAEFSRRRLSVQVVAYESGEALLRAADQISFEICFLDIYMSGISGVDAARVLRGKNKDTAIVFTTSSRDYFADGFAVNAVHYLVKPYAEVELCEAIDRCLRQIKEVERYIELTINRKNHRILLSELIWVESKNKVCQLHLYAEEKHTYMQLRELEQRLDDPRFLRCHHSFLINMDQVAGFDNGYFYMTDSAIVPIRQSERAQLRVTYENYLFEKMRRRP